MPTGRPELDAELTLLLGTKAYLTIDKPAVDWSGPFDFDQLAEACDGLVIMGYDYHYPGGNPGPNSLVQSGSIWSQWNLTWTLDGIGSKSDAVVEFRHLGRAQPDQTQRDDMSVDAGGGPAGQTYPAGGLRKPGLLRMASTGRPPQAWGAKRATRT